MTGRRPGVAPRPPHPDLAQRAIEAELVRVTLTGESRPELVAPIHQQQHLRSIRRRKARR